MLMKYVECDEYACCGPENCGEWKRVAERRTRVCIGMDCSAWREASERMVLDFLQREDEDFEESERIPIYGYCGLAGVPLLYSDQPVGKPKKLKAGMC